MKFKYIYIFLLLSTLFVNATTEESKEEACSKEDCLKMKCKHCNCSVGCSPREWQTDPKKYLPEEIDIPTWAPGVKAPYSESKCFCKPWDRDNADLCKGQKIED